MKKSSRAEKRIVLLSFAITFSILVLVLGFIKVDYEGRKMSINDTTPPFMVIENFDGTSTLKTKPFDIEKETDVTKINNLWKIIKDFCCIPNN